MTRIKLKSHQDAYVQAMNRYGLQRGIDSSEVKHISTRQYYRDLVQQTEQLQTDIEQFQDRRETVQEELRQAKREIQTEKLKGAVTTVAANIIESVDFLFGSNKARTLERENRSLHERIFELKEEARQGKQQQAKCIQEITDVYEQRHRKLLESVNFVKRYFPYVEKLVPTIKFLRDALNSDDRPIRKPCAFKDVSIKDDLYSPEFRQHFKTNGAACSLKQNTEGNLDSKIDGVLHVSWFRRRKDEFMKALGLPTRK